MLYYTKPGESLSFAQLTSYVLAGHPVIAWVDDTNSEVLQDSPTFMVTAGDGVQVPYPELGPGQLSTNEHVVVINGVEAGEVHILNPLGAGLNGWKANSYFTDSWATFGNMAVVLN